MKKLAVPVLSVLAAIGFVVSIYLIFMTTPLEYGVDERTGRLAGSSLFFNQKIFYFHVAHAIVLFAAVFVAGICVDPVPVEAQSEVRRHRERGHGDVAVAFGAASSPPARSGRRRRGTCGGTGSRG